ncbi:MAG TPA: hypothetical protein PLB67_01110 [Candidatus Hydrogenedentes bacterium]|nr:hypothetical protein [Candidatus Hydrogenedentota bacterium]MDY0032861.1 hypothetical protein [FCB group bacterium]NLT60614.1 hypothetical protein [Candidatus Hydrogenedentota bacterium]HNV21015.1 hypothetical protein [Candidatus Hydrogenedentota bacterium]HNZ18653.1 hypothetical protein [Candidatus Hydrogenedentota bacterium]
MSDVANDLRTEIRKGLEAIWKLECEEAVRIRVFSINSLIARRQMPLPPGAVNRVPLLEPEDVLKAWRERR